MPKKSTPEVESYFNRKKKIILALIILSIIATVAMFAYFAFGSLRNIYNEKVIDREFHKDISQYSDVRTTKFMLWEGDSLVTLDIPEKGQVSFWYGVDRVPRIESIGKYNTSFTCFNVDNNGKKISYAYDTDLWLDTTSPYTKKWFSFRVNTIGDLITHYNDILKVVDTFPKNPQLVNFHDSWGNRQVIKNSNPDFLIKPNKGNESPVCDMYFKNQ